jgi:hypothetical protein
LHKFSRNAAVKLVTILSQIPGLQEATIPVFPDTPTQLEFRALRSLTVDEQSLVRGHSVKAPKLQRLRVSFTKIEPNPLGSYIWDLELLRSLELLEISGFQSDVHNEAPYGGSSFSATSLTVSSSKVCSQMFEAICDSVRELTLEHNTFAFSQTGTMKFAKLSRLHIVGHCCHALVRNFKLPALTALSIRLGGKANGVPGLLSTLNGKDQTLKELNLRFEDDDNIMDYIMEMPPNLLDELTRFKQLEACRLLGVVLFTAPAWKIFAASNPFLQHVAVTLGDVEPHARFLTVRLSSTLNN